MTGRIIVSGGEKLRTFDLPGLFPGKETPLPGSGALCAGQGGVYAASDGESAIYRLDANTLLPCGVYAGGPGMRALCLSADGERLFALLADADSVLMLCARTGAPMVLARVGVCPQSMRLDNTGERLVIAGGRDGCAHILCSRTLRLLARHPSEGFCADASVRNGRIRALRLRGERGAAPGKLIAGHGVTLLLDRLNERLYLTEDARGEAWHFVCAGARDAALIWDKEESDRASFP